MKTLQTRRNFIKTTGCLTIGFTLGAVSAFPDVLSPVQELPRGLRRHTSVNAWLEILPDGSLRVYTGKIEIGQGIRTAVAQVAAEELYMRMNKVQVVIADTDRTPDEGYTSGSGSIEGSAMSVRYAAAYARQKLLELAAPRLNAPIADLWISDGRIGTDKNSSDISFSEVLDGRQIEDVVRPPVQLKPRKERHIIGKPVARKDIYFMVAAQPVFVHNLRFPAMVHARVVRPPSYKAKLRSIDENVAEREFPKLLKIVRNGSFLAVLSRDEYTAIKAQEYVQQNAGWTISEPLPDIADKKLPEYLKSLPTVDETVVNKGNFAGDTAEKEWISATYFKPYIMHGAIGPSCAVGLYKEDQLFIWTHSQGVFPLRETLSGMLGMPQENIHIQGVPGAGCYGHNGADDVAAEVALLALAHPGNHIRLQWSRQEEHAWEPYGSAMILENKARLSPQGRITHWEYDLWSDTHSTRPGGNPGRLLPARYLKRPMTDDSPGFLGGGYRNAEPYYQIPNQRVHAHFFKGPLRVSALRGLGAYANLFAIECFMDELAEHAGKDPYEFRLMHLDDPRARDVVQKLREQVSAESHPEGTGIGIAFSRYKNSAAYCAVAARVAVDKDNRINLQKMWSVIDAGETINPDGLKNQTEGGMIQSASWTLKEEVTFNTEHITSRDWNSYPVFRFNEIPEVDVTIIDRPDAPPLGAGEAAQGPSAAAVVNAVYHACGKRVRRLPLKKYL